VWTRLLDGALADDARAAVRAIAQDLPRAAIARPHPADAALFWAYAAGTLEDPAVDDSYADAVAALVEHTGSDIGPQLHGGLAGAGFALAHVGDNGGELLDAIDRRLAAIAAAWDGSYDLTTGLAGFGVYFLERLADPEAVHARAGLASVAAGIAARAEEEDGGVAWPTRQRWLASAQRAEIPDGDRDCGVAHGAPGAIAVLGRIAEVDAGVVPVLRGALRWLRARELPPQPGAGRYPFSVALPQRAGAAWCYGDPGIAVAAWSAAHRIGDDAQRWRELARSAAARPAEIEDLGLCHGAFGLAHIYNRCYQASRDVSFAVAARAWIAHGLSRRTKEGIGGFLLYESTDELLTGATGIGLALLAALTDQEPAWDRMLSTDLPAV
jgi:hypothetical protein